MTRTTPTQELVCRALAALGGVADATAVEAWVRATRGASLSPLDLHRETHALVDRGAVVLVGERDVGETLPSNVYALTPAGAALAVDLPADPGVNELAQDRVRTR